jgi:glycosyltransferase involved in cell wall biosynthesis
VNLSVYTVCFNEQLMLPHFLNYYSRFASKIIIYDNQSTDDSVSIAKSYPNVEVRSFDTNGRFSELTLTSIREHCWKNDSADYVIVCDVDEIVYCVGGDLLEFIKNRSEYTVFQPIGFEMISDQFPTDYNRSIIEQLQKGAFSGRFSKMVLFNPREISRMNFTTGSHDASPMGSKVKIDAAGQHCRYDLRLFHCKNLGFEYREARHRVLAERLASEEFERFNYGYHYGQVEAEQWKQFEAIKSHAFDCVQGPIPIGIKLRLLNRRWKLKKKQFGLYLQMKWMKT